METVLLDLRYAFPTYSAGVRGFSAVGHYLPLHWASAPNQPPLQRRRRELEPAALDVGPSREPHPRLIARATQFRWGWTSPSTFARGDQDFGLI